MVRNYPAVLFGMIVIMAWGITGGSRANGPSEPPRPQIARQHCDWVFESLKKMQTIQVGMTRADLLKIFTTEGGLSTRLRRTYVYRECPYIKVDVEFEPVGHPARDAEGRVTLIESERDVISKISRPYLGKMVLD